MDPAQWARYKGVQRAVQKFKAVLDRYRERSHRMQHSEAASPARAPAVRAATQKALADPVRSEGGAKTQSLDDEEILIMATLMGEDDALDGAGNANHGEQLSSDRGTPNSPPTVSSQDNFNVGIAPATYDAPDVLGTRRPSVLLTLGDGPDLGMRRASVASRRAIALEKQARKSVITSGRLSSSVFNTEELIATLGNSRSSTSVARARSSSALGSAMVAGMASRGGASISETEDTHAAAVAQLLHIMDSTANGLKLNIE